MRFRARYRGKSTAGRYVTTQMFLNSSTQAEAELEAEQRVSEIQQKLTEREGSEVNNVVCWKIEPHESPKQKRK